jgi:hypothetical protein
MNTRVLGAIIATLGLFAVLSLQDCKDPTREAITAAVEDVVLAVETGDRDRLGSWIAADYRDRLGHDNETIVRRVMDEVEHYDALDIALDHLAIKIEEKTGFATATFLPRFIGDADAAKKTRPKYTFKKGQRLRVKLRKHGDRWLIVRGDMTVSIRGAL